MMVIDLILFTFNCKLYSAPILWQMRIVRCPVRARVGVGEFVIVGRGPRVDSCEVRVSGRSEGPAKRRLRLICRLGAFP